MPEVTNRLSDKEKALKDALLKKEITVPVYYFAEVTSTMDSAKEILKSEKEGTAIVVSDLQTAGRGRQSREWLSRPGNLFVTYTFPVQGELSKYSGFSLVAGLACFNTLANMGCRTRLKWPNDILSISGKKLGGILIEIIQEGNSSYILCGIGINLEAAPSGLGEVTSVKDLTGESVSASTMILRLTPALNMHYRKFVENGFSAFRNEWNQAGAYIGRDISVHISKDNKVTGMMMGVSSDGSLQIENGGKIQTVTAGDVLLNES